MGRQTRESAAELRAVAALVVTGGSPQLVGPCTLVTNGRQTIAFSSAELLRHAKEPLAIALTLDGSRTLPVASWVIGRAAGIGIIELGEAFPTGGSLDVAPLAIDAVSATVETRGAPAGLVLVEPHAAGWSRRVVPVFVDAVDGAGMSDEVLSRLATPTDAADARTAIDGAPLFAWMPADPVLGRPGEVVAVALGVPYRSRAFQPREQPAIAELVGLEDLGRALPWEGQPEEEGNELGQVAGEIRDDETGPLAGLELDND